MKYDDVLPIEREQAEKAFQGSSSPEIVHALLGVTYHEADWQWVQDRCLSFLDSNVPSVRDTAIACSGHLRESTARSTRERSCPPCQKNLPTRNVPGAEDAIEDIEMFTKEPA